MARKSSKQSLKTSIVDVDVVSNLEAMNEVQDLHKVGLQDSSSKPVLWIDTNNVRETGTGDELDWVRKQLENRVQLKRVIWRADKYARNGGILLQPSNDSQRSESAASGAVDEQQGQFYSHIYISSLNRSDDLLTAYQWVALNYPDSQKVLVLGEWWTGHRRTWPLREMRAVYWYQCHDVLIPNLIEDSSSHGVESVGEDAAQMCLIYATDGSSRKFWSEIVPSLGYIPLAISQLDKFPEGDIKLVWLDADWAESDWLSHPNFKSIRTKYPLAKIVVTWGFPRWSEVMQIGNAIDFVLGKQFDLRGFGRMLAGNA